MAVYGNLLSSFPELHRNIDVFTKEDKSDLRTIRAVFMTSKGDRLKQQKFTNRGTAVNLYGNDYLYVPRTYRSKVSVGDYFYSPYSVLCRIVGEEEWEFEGGYVRFLTEKVSGASVDHTEPLVVKEAEYD